MKISDILKEIKMIKLKIVFFIKISNMKGINNNLKEKKYWNIKNVFIIKVNNMKISNVINENKNF